MVKIRVASWKSERCPPSAAVTGVCSGRPSPRGPHPAPMRILTSSSPLCRHRSDSRCCENRKRTAWPQTSPHCDTECQREHTGSNTSDTLRHGCGDPQRPAQRSSGPQTLLSGDREPAGEGPCTGEGARGGGSTPESGGRQLHLGTATFEKKRARIPAQKVGRQRGRRGGDVALKTPASPLSGPGFWPQKAGAKPGPRFDAGTLEWDAKCQPQRLHCTGALRGWGSVALLAANATSSATGPQLAPAPSKRP